MESWRRVFKEGFAPQCSTAELVALRDALVADDPHILQGATTSPPPLMCVRDWPVEDACPWAWVGAYRHGGIKAATVAETEEEFSIFCQGCDLLLGEPASSRWFLNAWDDGKRDTMRRAVIEEINTILEARANAAATTPVQG